MDYYNMMYGRMRHNELIAEAQRVNRIVADAGASRATFLAGIASAVQRLFRAREVVQQPSVTTHRLAAK